MSIQNILQPNNLVLYAGNIAADKITVDVIDSLATGDPVFILPTEADENDVVVNKNLITSADLAVSLGAAGQGYRDVFCQNLRGLGGTVQQNYSPVNIPGGVNFFDPSTPANTPYASLLDTYYSITQADLTLQIGGAYANPAVPLNYKATIIGNLVTMSILVPAKSIAPGPTGPITITGLTSNFYPEFPQSIQIDVDSDSNLIQGVIYIDTGGLITIYPGYSTAAVFTSGQPIGLGIIETGSVASYLTFSYIL